MYTKQYNNKIIHIWFKWDGKYIHISLLNRNVCIENWKLPLMDRVTFHLETHFGKLLRFMNINY